MPALEVGKLIKRKTGPLHYWDTFHSVAVRQFEMEVRMLAESIADLKQGASLGELPASGVVHRRMSHALELSLFDRLRDIIDERATDG